MNEQDYSEFRSCHLSKLLSHQTTNPLLEQVSASPRWSYFPIGHRYLCPNTSQPQPQLHTHACYLSKLLSHQTTNPLLEQVSASPRWSYFLTDHCCSHPNTSQHRRQQRMRIDFRASSFPLSRLRKLRSHRLSIPTLKQGSLMRQLNCRPIGHCCSHPNTSQHLIQQRRYANRPLKCS